MSVTAFVCLRVCLRANSSRTAWGMETRMVPCCHKLSGACFKPLHTGQITIFSWEKYTQCTSACCMLVMGLSMPVYMKIWKLKQNFNPNLSFCPYRKNFLEFGLKNSQIHVNGWNMAQNLLSRNKNFFNWSRGLRNMNQNTDFERERIVAHSCHIMGKVG